MERKRDLPERKRDLLERKRDLALGEGGRGALQHFIHPQQILVGATGLLEFALELRDLGAHLVVFRHPG